MGKQATSVVTGAFGFSGKYMAARLLAKGQRLRTLTNSVSRENPFAGRIEVSPYNFGHPKLLVASLRGAEVLYNTYWVRFNHRGLRGFGFAEAVENSRTLFAAAKEAGVGRVVHVSITNASEDSPLEYFRGKALVERALKESGLSHAILRPAVLFGQEDVLVNNIAWGLRHLPFFALFGDGQYRLQPIYVDDLAALAVEQGAGVENVTIDAIGPETFTYRGLVEEIGRIIDCPRKLVPVSPGTGHLLTWLLGQVVRDVVLTRQEIQGLMRELLYTSSEPVGATRLTDWARANAQGLGRRYASELSRRLNRELAYERL